MKKHLKLFSIQSYFLNFIVSLFYAYHIAYDPFCSSA